jgi:hypothetical protein
MRIKTDDGCFPCAGRGGSWVTVSGKLALSYVTYRLQALLGSCVCMQAMIKGDCL